jgi:hypothetical protein
MPQQWVGYAANVSLARHAIVEITRELQAAKMLEESAWAAFFSALDTDNTPMIRKYMNSYLRRSAEREAIEQRLLEARQEEVYRADLYSKNLRAQNEQRKIRRIG